MRGTLIKKITILGISITYSTDPRIKHTSLLQEELISLGSLNQYKKLLNEFVYMDFDH